MASVALVQAPKELFVFSLDDGERIAHRSQQSIVYLGRLFIGSTDFSVHGEEIGKNSFIALYNQRGFWNVGRNSKISLTNI